MDILLLSTADWDNPYWTNKQHVAQELARLGHRILYVESLGLRRPTATGKDAKRIVKRLRKVVTAPRQVRPNLWVYSPLVLPAHDSPTVQRINRRLLWAQIGHWLHKLKIKPALLWTYMPLTPILLDTSRFPRTVYHNVDDISAQPGMPRAAIQTAEQALLVQADIIFTTAPALQDKSLKANPNSHYLPNVADFDHFSKALLPETQVPADLAAIPSPRVGFVGAISGYKMDFPLLRAVALARPSVSFVLIGEVGEGDPTTNADALRGLPNVHLIGARAYADLPAYLKGFDAAMLPQRLNEYTASMFPMKFFEYLAAGLPVISTELPALAGFDGVARFATDAESFAAGVDACLAGAVGTLEARHAVAEERTYKVRTQRMLTLIEALDKGR